MKQDCLLCPCGYGDLNAHQFKKHLMARHSVPSDITEKTVIEDFFHYGLEPFQRFKVCKKKVGQERCMFRTPFAELFSKHACTSDMKVVHLPADVTFKLKVAGKQPQKGIPPPEKRRLPPHLWPDWQAIIQKEQEEDKQYREVLRQEKDRSTRERSREDSRRYRSSAARGGEQVRASEPSDRYQPRPQRSPRADRRKVEKVTDDKRESELQVHDKSMFPNLIQSQKPDAQIVSAYQRVAQDVEQRSAVTEKGDFDPGIYKPKPKSDEFTMEEAMNLDPEHDLTVTDEGVAAAEPSEVAFSSDSASSVTEGPDDPAELSEEEDGEIRDESQQSKAAEPASGSQTEPVTSGNDEDSTCVMSAAIIDVENVSDRTVVAEAAEATAAVSETQKPMDTSEATAVKEKVVVQKATPTSSSTSAASYATAAAATPKADMMYEDVRKKTGELIQDSEGKWVFNPDFRPQLTLPDNPIPLRRDEYEIDWEAVDELKLPKMRENASSYTLFREAEGHHTSDYTGDPRTVSTGMLQISEMMGQTAITPRFRINVLGRLCLGRYVICDKHGQPAGYASVTLHWAADSRPDDDLVIMQPNPWNVPVFAELMDVSRRPATITQIICLSVNLSPGKYMLAMTNRSQPIPVIIKQAKRFWGNYLFPQQREKPEDKRRRREERLSEWRPA